MTPKTDASCQKCLTKWSYSFNGYLLDFLTKTQTKNTTKHNRSYVMQKLHASECENAENAHFRISAKTFCVKMRGNAHFDGWFCENIACLRINAHECCASISRWCTIVINFKYFYHPLNRQAPGVVLKLFWNIYWHVFWESRCDVCAFMRIIRKKCVNLNFLTRKRPLKIFQVSSEFSRQHLIKFMKINDFPQKCILYIHAHFSAETRVICA